MRGRRGQSWLDAPHVPESIKKIYSGRSNGLGEVGPSRLVGEGEYWDTIFDGGPPVPPMAPVWGPHTEPCEVPGMEAIQQVIDCHLMLRMKWLLTWFKQQAQCGTYFVKNPNQHQSPITARPLDRRVQVSLDADVGLAIMTIQNTDKDIMVLDRIGMAYNPPDLAGDIQFTITIDGKPMDEYSPIDQMIGPFETPTYLAIPQVIKGISTIVITAFNNNIADPIEVFFRIMGYTYPALKFTDDGSHDFLHTR